MKALIGVVIILFAVGLLFESMYKIKMVFKNFSKDNNGKIGKDFNFDFKNQFNNISVEKREEFIKSLSEDKKVLFKEYLSCNKEDENLLREKLDEKHVFNMFNRWARQNNIEPINTSNYKIL